MKNLPACALLAALLMRAVLKSDKPDASLKRRTVAFWPSQRTAVLVRRLVRRVVVVWERLLVGCDAYACADPPEGLPARADEAAARLSLPLEPTAGARRVRHRHVDQPALALPGVAAALLGALRVPDPPVPGHVLELVHQELRGVHADFQLRGPVLVADLLPHRTAQRGALQQLARGRAEPWGCLDHLLDEDEVVHGSRWTPPGHERDQPLRAIRVGVVPKESMYLRRRNARAKHQQIHYARRVDVVRPPWLGDRKSILDFGWLV
mmetsp:Transcript_28994/g.77459  ORF Transcript_28994/g.77459 Transcript_28994/m.77459 type:complete len:265 (+) Transcript_28994:648-1442(+)